MSDPNQLPQPDPNLFDPKNEAKSLFVKWGKVGDWVQGTLHDRRQIKSTLPGQEGKMQHVYDFFARAGVFHETHKSRNEAGEEVTTYTPVVLKEGQLVSVGGGTVGDDKNPIDNGLRNVKIGQIFGVRFTEIKPAKTKGFQDQKVRKVYPGEMDPKYAGGMDVAAELGVPDMA